MLRVTIATVGLILGLFQLNFATEIKVEKGVLDLRGKDMNTLNNIGLSGEWEFYWNQLINPEDFSNNIKPLNYITVPSVWNDYVLNGEKLPGKGAATYRMKVLLDSASLMAFKLGGIGTAFTLYVNNKKMYSAGNVSLNELDGKPAFKPGIVSFMPDSDTLEVIFQVSNYDYCKAGLWSDYNKFGLAKKIIKSRERSIHISILLIGSILFFALYHLGLFFLNRNFRFTIFFSLFCLVMVLRALVINEILLLEVIPNIRFNALIKLEYLTMLLATASFSVFIYKFYEKYYSKRFMLFVVFINTFFSLIVLFTNPLFFTKYLIIYQIDVLVAALYIAFIVVKAAIKGSKSALIILIGFIFLLVTTINDILYTYGVYSTIYLTSFGVMMFVFSQAYMLSVRFSSLLNKTDALAKELEVANNSLELKVKERTSQVQDQNNQLLEQSNEIVAKNNLLEQVNEELKAQHYNLQVQNELVIIQKKQITDSIEYASRIQSAMLDSTNEIKLVAPNNFILFKPKDIVSGDFYWFKELDVDGKKYKIATIVDCTGHGVPGAFMSILGALLLNRIVNEISAKPTASEILNKMRKEVKIILQQNEVALIKDGMEMALVVIDYENMQLQFSGANNPLYIIRGDKINTNIEIEEYKGDLMPIGVYIKERAEFTNHCIPIAKNDLIYMFSDGYYDQFGGKHGKKLMKNTFKNILKANANLPLKKQKEVFEKELKEWQGNYEQIDDITVVGIKI